jgi:hypothetical protein
MKTSKLLSSGSVFFRRPQVEARTNHVTAHLVKQDALHAGLQEARIFDDNVNAVPPRAAPIFGRGDGKVKTLAD